MKEQINILSKLQEIEIETQSIKSTLSDVSRKIETLDADLKEFERTIEDRESVFNELEKKYRDYESDVRINLDHEKKIQAKLRSVKTNKEYQSLLKEIEDVKTKNSNIEDKMIECLDRMDETERIIEMKREEFLQFSDRAKREKEIIKQAAEQGKNKISKLDIDWKEISCMISPELLNKYLSIIKQQQGGLAVVSVKDAVCNGCNVNLPPQLYNELFRGDKLNFCPNCQRIIYLKES